MEKKVVFNTTVSESLIKRVKVLVNELLAEAIEDILKKYDEKVVYT